MSDTVLVAVKTPMMQRPITAVLPRQLSLAEAVQELQLSSPDDTDSQRVLQQLAREMSDTHDYLAVANGGELARVDRPGDTSLGDISTTHEVRGKNGIEKMPIAAFEIQSYAPVG